MKNYKLSDFKQGAKFKGVLNSGEKVEGMVQVEDGKVFLCSNHKELDGDWYNDKLGYLHSWCISGVFEAAFISYFQSFQFIEEEQEFEELTRGGYKFDITRRDRGDGMVNGEIFINNVWHSETWYKDGRYYSKGEHTYDLIPINTRKKELQAKESELLKQLEEIRKELGNEN